MISLYLFFSCIPSPYLVYSDLLALIRKLFFWLFLKPPFYIIFLDLNVIQTKFSLSYCIELIKNNYFQQVFNKTICYHIATNTILKGVFYMNENLLTIDDVCHELGIGKSTAYKLLKSKKITPFSELCVFLT